MKPPPKISYKKRKRLVAGADATRPEATVTRGGRIVSGSKPEPAGRARDRSIAGAGKDKSGPVEISAKQRDEAVMNEIRRRWPTIFDPAEPVPLKIGIFEDLVGELAEDIDAEASPIGKAALRRVLKWWTRREPYLSVLACLGAWRIDLDGGNVEPVSDEHRAWAAEKLMKLKAKQDGS